jgi:hypothetical protein
VVILEDDRGYESVLRNVGESRGWQLVIGAALDDVAGSIEWADVAIIDLDAAAGDEVLRTVRARRSSLPVVAVSGDPAASTSSTGADAVVHQLPVGLVEAVNDVTAPPEVIDLTDDAPEAEPEGDRPWYATS